MKITKKLFTLLCIICLGLSFSTNAQSLNTWEDTVDWINSKLKKGAKHETISLNEHPTTETIFKVRYNGLLELTEHYTYSKSYLSQYTPVLKEISQAYIYDIRDVDMYRANSIMIEFKRESVKRHEYRSYKEETYVDRSIHLFFKDQATAEKVLIAFERLEELGKEKKFYDQYGALINLTTYKNELKYIKRKDFYPSDKIKAIGYTSYAKINRDTYKIENEKKESEWKYYFENGNLRSQGNYVNGKKNGEWNYFNEDGTIVLTDNYLDGEPLGVQQTYHENGALN